MTEHESQPFQQNDTSRQPNTNGDHYPLRAVCKDIHERIYTFMGQETKEENVKWAQLQCGNSLRVIEETLKRYPLENLSLSYNGGKDCLVLLLLYLAALHDYPDLPKSLPAIYITPPNPFPAVDEFVATSSAQYHLALTRHTSPTNSMKEAFTSYLSSTSGSHVKAIFVGTRRTDPHGGKLGFFDMTDRGWPEFMRVHPVLEWKYVDVWAFLRHMNVEWCELYDQGFTSLGGVGDTHPNPKLRVVDESGKERFEPAWVLKEDEAERLGRN